MTHINAQIGPSLRRNKIDLLRSRTLTKSGESSQTIKHKLLVSPSTVYSVDEDSEDEDKATFFGQNKRDRHLYIKFLLGDPSEKPEEDDSEVSVDEPPRHYSR